MQYGQRPPLSSRQRRVARRDRLRVVPPFAAVLLIGFALGWFLKPGAEVVDPTSGCTIVSVIPADVLPQPSSISVNVFNATKRVGLASITGVDLKTRGFRVGTIGSSSDDIPGIGEIRYGLAGEMAAKRLAAYVPGTTPRLVQVKAADDTSIDLVLGDAFVAVAPDEQVTAVLAVPSLQAKGSNCPTT